MRHLLIILFIVSFGSKTGYAQNLWDDNTALDSLKSGIHAIYNFNFERAEAISHKIEQKHPDHPALLMYNALILYWKHYPLLADTEIGDKYEALLLKSLDESKVELHEHPDHQLTNFFAMMPRMMLLQYNADNGLGIRSIPHLSKAYESIVKGFDFCKTTPEYYFTTGLYNYYIEAYPEANPFYKPFVFFFPDGDKKKGLNQLYKCWKQSDYIGPEAMTFLTYIYINFESDYTTGVKFAKELSHDYNHNPLFGQYYVQLLLLTKQYDKAAPIVDQFKADPGISPFFKTVFNVLNAIVIEQDQTKMNRAETLYQNSIIELEPYGNYGNRYKAYAYFGLSRIYKGKGQSDQAAIYHSKAMKAAQYPQVNFD
ncbi:MAG: hypothetical protein ACERKD_22010 [Prolixibacteraceae bacterium]